MAQKKTNQDIDVRLVVERLSVVADEAPRTLVFCVLALLCIGVLARNHISLWLVLCSLGLPVLYILRIWLGKHFLGLPLEQQLNKHWHAGFVTIATITGSLWGVTIFILILEEIPGTQFYLALLISTLTAAAIPSLGVLPLAFFGFVLGMFSPISLAFLFNGIEFNFSLAVVTIAFSLFLVITANNFRKKFDRRIYQTLSNEKFSHHLISEKRKSDESLTQFKASVAERLQDSGAIEHQRIVLANSHGIIPGMSYRAINDGRWTLEFIGEGCKNLLGVSSEQLYAEGKDSLSDILVRSGRDQPDYMAPDYDDGVTFRYEYILLTPGGGERMVIERGHRIIDDLGMLKAIEGLVTDASENYKELFDTSNQSSRDYLTDLPNRKQFEAVLEDKFYADDIDQLALLLIDLDRLSLINNTFSYAAGDKAINQVCDLLRNDFSSENIFSARLAGDEFGILISNCDESEATRTATELCLAIDNHVFKYKTTSFDLTTSIGVAIAATDSGSDLELFKAADNARYTAKEAGGNCVRTHDPEAASLLQQEQQWSLEISKALKSDQLLLDQQLIKKLDGPDKAKEKWLEIQLDINDIGGISLPPDKPGPMLIKYNLAVSLDIWVVNQIIDYLKSPSSLPDESGLYFLGLSDASVIEPVFQKNMIAVLENNRDLASRLCFQVTETVVNSKTEAIDAFIQCIQYFDCKLAITGNSNLLTRSARLPDLPIDFIKIDSRLILDLVENLSSDFIITSIKKLTEAGKVEIIVEQIETTDNREYLTSLGLEYGQGEAIGLAEPFPS